MNMMDPLLRHLNESQQKTINRLVVSSKVRLVASCSYLINLEEKKKNKTGRRSRIVPRRRPGVFQTTNLALGVSKDLEFWTPPVLFPAT